MVSTANLQSKPVDERFVVYERQRGWAALNVRELWAYRELLYFLTWRDILVRYKQAVMGVAWAVLQPLLTMVVFTVVFNKALGVQSPSSDVPYPVFSFAGLLPWQFFAGALSRSGVSLVGNANLLTKVYFPRLVIPISAVLGGLVDLGDLVRRPARADGRATASPPPGTWSSCRCSSCWRSRRRWPSASGSAPSTCSTATCSTSSPSSCSCGCSSAR